MCSFCPFYKEKFDEARRDEYLRAVREEIRQTKMDGTCSWLYIGGGTPNVLSVPELQSILSAFPKDLPPGSLGIELLPSLASPDYLSALAETGFTKISIGIESLQEETLRESGRAPVPHRHVAELLDCARKHGLWSNVDMMVGLAKQSRESFLADTKEVATLLPSQVTIYPYMVLRNSPGESSMSSHEQFAIIEEAGSILRGKGYERKGVWTWGRGDDIYDSSRDELVTDYAGFGPTAFSTYGNWKVVNPEMDVYLDRYSGKRTEAMGFVGVKTKATDDWRKFARMVYDLRCSRIETVPRYINLYIAFLRFLGYGRNGTLTQKGVMFAHEITKTVVESLPFPIQNPAVVVNYADYLDCRSGIAK